MRGFLFRNWKHPSDKKNQFKMKLQATIQLLLLLSLCLANALAQDIFYPFEDPDLPWDERVENLVSLLTLDEIILQVSRGGEGINGPAPAIPRLGIGPYSWNTECVGGDSRSGKATSFPQPIGFSASFDVELQRQVAEATSTEVRAKYYNYVANGQYGDAKGLSCFSPVVNIMRHPLWGRNQETYGEDPYLSGQISVGYVQGIQGDDPRYLRANAGCKHFSVHGGPENIPVSRNDFDAVVSARDWQVTFLPAFHQCIRAGAYGVMCSFNRINGVPACANKEMLTDILRDKWGFTGYVTSDQDAIEFVQSQHHWTNTIADTAAECIKAGTNIDLCSDLPDNAYFVGIPQAIQEGILTEEDIRKIVKPLFYTRFRLGEFDPPSMNPYSNIDLSVVQSEEHQSLSLKAAMKTFVLLKNDNDLLPLTQTYETISVVGPMIDNPQQLFGQYSADYDPLYTVTPLNGLKLLAANTNNASGCNDNKCETYNAAEITAAVNGAEIVFVCLGTGKQVESEGNDRGELVLPGQQGQLLKDVIAASGGAPIVLLLFTASPVQIDQESLDAVTAIIECFIPAQTAGEAIRRVLLKEGEDSVPAARLPFTWPTSLAQVPDMTLYTMDNRTYRYWDQDPPLYPFGYGLSYTEFRYSNLDISPTVINAGQSVFVSGIVQNVGVHDADEIVQVYISWKTTTQVMPKLQLVGFDRVHVLSGSTYAFTFEINAERMEVYVDDIGFVVESGTIGVYVGGQQPNQVTTVGSNLLAGEFTIA